ncbi:hypothetical protein FB451DRAFT_1250461 [Mycena latifolia]|nr:hypothetical protein FB451DRAFT_1250461 [Mycena latifolia]
MNLPYSFLRTSFRVARRPITTRRLHPPFHCQRAHLSTHPQHESPKHSPDDVVSEIPLSDGTTCPLKFTRFPRTTSPTDEPSTACLLWGDTMAALNASGFQPNPIPAPSGPEMYTIAPSTVAGTGFFAKRDIECGEIVIVERPFLIAAAQTPLDSDVPDPTIRSAVFDVLDLVVAKRLSKREQIDLTRLFSSDYSIYQIVSQNAIPILESLPGPYEGVHFVVCRDISRINHSCTPNAELVWDISSFTVSIASTTRIPKGEEVFRSYTNQFAPPARAERMQFLEAQFDFKCACPSCSLPDDQSSQSDEIRRLIAQDMKDITFALVRAQEASQETQSDPELSAWLGDASLPDDHIIAHSERLVDMMERERVGSMLHRLIHYVRLTGAFLALGDANKARYWASRMKALMAPGSQFSEYMDYASGVMTDPEKEEEWNARRKSHSGTET